MGTMHNKRANFMDLFTCMKNSVKELHFRSVIMSIIGMSKILGSFGQIMTSLNVKIDKETVFERQILVHLTGFSTRTIDVYSLTSKFYPTIQMCRY